VDIANERHEEQLLFLDRQLVAAAWATVPPADKKQQSLMAHFMRQLHKGDSTPHSSLLLLQALLMRWHFANLMQQSQLQKSASQQLSSASGIAAEQPMCSFHGWCSRPTHCDAADIAYLSVGSSSAFLPPLLLPNMRKCLFLLYTALSTTHTRSMLPPGARLLASAAEGALAR